MKELQPGLGIRLRKIRREKDIRQNVLANMIPVRQSLISQIESGKIESTTSTLKKIAEALNVPFSQLIGDESEGSNLRPSNARPFSNTVKLPVFTVATAASCGAGNALDYADFETEKNIYKERDFFRAWDDSHTPFCIHVEGDSMIGADLADGDIAVINPAEDVTNGQTALVCWRGDWFIKWVFFNLDGSVELRSANPNYGSIFIEEEYANNADFFRVIGKVVDIQQNKKPRSAY